MLQSGGGSEKEATRGLIYVYAYPYPYASMNASMRKYAWHLLALVDTWWLARPGIHQIHQWYQMKLRCPRWATRTVFQRSCAPRAPHAPAFRPHFARFSLGLRPRGPGILASPTVLENGDPMQSRRRRTAEQQPNSNRPPDPLGLGRTPNAELQTACFGCLAPTRESGISSSIAPR